MNRTQSHTMSRQHLRNGAILVLLLFSPGLGLSASPEEVLTRAIRGILAPGEGQTSEAIYAAQGGAASEADLPLVARARYTYKAPRARVEVTDAGSKALRVVVHDGREVWLLTQVGATRLAEAAPEVRRSLSDQAFPMGLSAAGARLGGGEAIAGRQAQIVEGTGPDGPWTLWVDAADGRLLRYRLRGGEQVGDLTYGSGDVLRKVSVKNAQGRFVMIRFRDVPAKVAIDDKLFSFEQAKAGTDLGEALARGLTAGRTTGPAVTATAGARGVDEEVQRKQLGQMRLDYQALQEVERFRVNEADIENFLRAGKLGRYRE